MRLRLRQRYGVIIAIMAVAIVAVFELVNLIDTLRLAREVEKSSGEAMSVALIREVELAASNVATVMANSLIEPVAEDDFEQIFNITGSVLTLPYVLDVRVYDADGTAIHDGTEQILAYGTKVSSIIADRVLAGGETIISVSDEAVEISAPISLGDKAIGAVHLSTSMERVSQDIAQLVQDLGEINKDNARKEIADVVIMAVILSVLGIVAGVVIASHLSRPIQTLINLTRQIGRRDYNVEIPWERSDELGELAVALKSMAEELEESTVSRSQLEEEVRDRTRALSRNEAQLRQIIDLLPHEVYIKDREGRFVLVNRAQAEVYGTTVGDLTGAVELERHHNAETARRYHAQDLEVITSGRPIFIPDEVRVDAKDETYHQTTKVPYELSNGGMAALGITVDITEQKRAQARARRHEAELARVLRMGTMWEMASGLGHQINQPLTAIVNYVGGAQQEFRARKWLREDMIEVLAEIHREANRASEIVRHITRFIRRAEPQTEPMHVNAMIRSAVELATSELEDNEVEHDLHLQQDIPTVLADRIQIEQAFLNLIRNAIEAMPDTPKRERRIVIHSAATDAEGVEITVKDHGPGVPSEDLERIFEPFFSTRPSGMGLGMGLSITRTIVEAHGGRVDISNNGDKGATFRVQLPVAGKVSATAHDL